MKRFVASSVVTMLALSIALPVLAQGDVLDAYSSSSSVPENAGKKKGKLNKPVVQVDSACMQGAIEKRDSAIISAVDAYAAAVKAALQTRKDALKAAWAITDNARRNAALKAAWAAFNGTWKNARQALNEQRKAAWSAFKADAKACKQPGADASGEKMDGSL